MLTQQQQSNLKSGAAAAVASERQTGVPAECTVAQWAEESGWGKNSPGNNCFGIKWYSTATGRQTAVDDGMVYSVAIRRLLAIGR